MASSPLIPKTRSSNRIAPSPDDDEKGKGSDKHGDISKTQKKAVGASPKTAKKDCKPNTKDLKKEGTTNNGADAKVETDPDEGVTTVETDKGRKKQKVAVPTRQMPPRSTKSPKAGSSTSSGNPKDPSPVALLDMLAEVAAATLSKNSDTPKAAKIAQRKKIMKKLAEVKMKHQQSNSDRPNQRSETLNLDQLRTLSDKLLLNMFAELTADEMRRNYTFTCFLVPDKCNQKYHSFGNETKARLQMKTHLLSHITELMVETNAEGKVEKGNFTAEPVLARKRRLAVEEEIARKKKRTCKQSPPKPEQEKATGSKAKAKDADSIQMQVEAASDSGEFTVLRKLEKSTDKEKPKAKESNENKAESDLGLEMEADNSVVQQITMKKEIDVEVLEEPCEFEVVTETIDADDGDQAEVNIDYDQPYHDHCYTNISGGKKLVPDFYDEYDDEFEAEDEAYNEDAVVVGDIDCSASTKVQTVYIGEATSDATYEIEQNSDGGEEEEAATKVVEEQQRSQQTETAIRQLEVLRHIQKSRKQVYPPVKLLEEEMARSLEEDSLGSLDDEDIKQGSPDWERKMALQCIRYLRTKKKDEHVALVCRICKGRAFTAQATLMYHYRSHAGIKPFVCSICNTTFTRQHSLNYHMLIHNNKSRFTCGDCGRKFRHPSHFKEHMRRHTGETPFECSDCCVRFKTRNTYKRHLKTRHGKLLTANGIVPLTAEEFQKVKTNPKRRPHPRKDQETQWPDPEIGIMHATDEDQPTISAVESLVAMQIKENAEEGNMILPDALEVEEEEEENVGEAEEGDMVDINSGSMPVSVNVDSNMEPILAEFNNETQLIHISDDDKITFLRADTSTVNSDGTQTFVLTPIDIMPDGTGPAEWLTGNLDMCTIQAVSLSPLKCT